MEQAINTSADASSRGGDDIIRIQAGKDPLSAALRELWRYRELLYFLTWRDIKVRYKQTLLGFSWAILQPLIAMVIFSLFFGRLAKMPSDGLPYPLFSFAALVPWTFFSTGVGKASNVLVGSQNLLRKVYFPRLAMPIASILAGVVDFALAFSVLLVMMVWYGIMPTVNVLWLPLLFLLAFCTALGISLWLSAMNVRYRDVRYITPFLVQAWMFMTPVVYPATLIENPLVRAAYALNPMVGVVEGFRWALLGMNTAPGPMIAVSACAALLMLVSGVAYFRRMERDFADVV